MSGFRWDEPAYERAMPMMTPSGSEDHVLPHTRRTLDHLMPDVYDELRAIARRQLSIRGGQQTLATSGLVHEAYLRLSTQSTVAWADRGHFIALTALAMRHVLVDRAKARQATKRGGPLRQVTLDESSFAADQQSDALLEIHEAVERLAAVEPRLAELIDCRFFAGLSEAEIAEARGVTTRTVQRDWAKARMLLRRALAT